MNIHTKREKEFVAKLLKLLKKKGVLLLKPSELPAFVESRRPPNIGQAERLQGHRLGHLNADMRLLVAITKHFDQGFQMESKRNYDSRATLRMLSLHEVSCLCADAFWTLLKERFEDKENFQTRRYVLLNDWSIHFEERTTDLPWPNYLKWLLLRLESQLLTFQLLRP